MRRSPRPVPITTDRPSWRAALTTTLLLLAVPTVASAPADTPAPYDPAAPPLVLSVAFGDGARLGRSTSLDIRLRVAPGQAKVKEVRILTPAGIDLSSSGLGMATCRRPERFIRTVMNAVERRPCPRNALMGTGVATAELRFDKEEVFDGAAELAVYNGESVEDKPGLIVVANANRPVRTQLTYRGYLYIPPPGFGVGMAIQVLPIPRPPFNAPVALSSFRLVVGSPALRYVRRQSGRAVSYHPRAIPLPDRCPAGGFRFRAIVRLDDGTRLTHDALVRCPQQ